MKSLLCLLFAIGLSLSLRAADSSASADMLNRWVGGKWVGSGKFVDSDYSKTNTASATTKCAWSPDRVFVICDQDIVFGGQPMRELSIYTFTPKDGKYYFYGISLGEEKARNTALEITDNGNRWIYSSTNEIKGKPVQFRTTNQFHGNDNVEWWTEFSADEGKTWTKTGSGKETREKGSN
jgi:hypothetical protein